MSWLDVLNTPVEDLFRKKETGPEEKKKNAAAPSAPGLGQLPKEIADSPEAKGVMAMFYRKWKDPAFIKQLKSLAAHMAKDGVDLKNQSAVKEWLEKNKEGLETGKFNDAPAGGGGKVETYVKTGPDVGRNDPCPCGSGKKYKKCCATK